MPITLTAALFNLAVALGCGLLIGTERALRRRWAGMRTNALVSVGAAAFVLFSARMVGDASPTRIASEVVSGIGFLGAGIIFRDGLNVHGLTTAATLWCAAAVGVLAGGGHWDLAMAATATVALVNLGLRPVVRMVRRQVGVGRRGAGQFRLAVVAREGREEAARRHLLRALAAAEECVAGVERRALEEGLVEIAATVEAGDDTEATLEQIVVDLSAEPDLRAVNWGPQENA